MAPAKHKPGSSRKSAGKQKTSTPSRSRIEQYMSPGDISKIVGSPMHTRNLDLGSSALESDGDHGILSVSRVKSQMSSRSYAGEDSPNDTVKKRAVPRAVTSSSRHQKSSNPKQTSSLSTATIDKFMSPDCSNSLVSTPTRFPRLSKRVGDVTDDEESPKSRGQGKQKKDSKLGGKASSSAEGTVPATSGGNQQFHRNHGSKETVGKEKYKGAKRKSSDSVPSSGRKKQKAHEGTSSEDEEATSDEGVDSIIQIKASTNFMASGDVETHMADKEFLASQVHTMCKPFNMNAGPAQWLQIWKARKLDASDDDDDDESDDDLPDKVIHKAVAKLNTAMNSELGPRLSRHKQRKVLINLDKVRGQEQKKKTQGGVEKLHDSLRLGASLDEILEHYPSEWPVAADDMDEPPSEQQEELTNRYAEARARLFSISGTLADKETEHKNLQDVYDQLKDIDANLTRCTDTDFKEELHRTKSLVSQILKKLNQRRSPRKQRAATETPVACEKKSMDTDMYSEMIGSHKTLINQLFDIAT